MLKIQKLPFKKEKFWNFEFLFKSEIFEFMFESKNFELLFKSEKINKISKKKTLKFYSNFVEI